MITEEIRKELLHLADSKYRDFMVPLIPTVNPDTVIGIRTPSLRKYAKDLKSRPDIGDFLHGLPHHYFEENQLHAFLISESRDYESCIGEISLFLPFVDNWATCDQMNPGILKKHHAKLLSDIRTWIASGDTYSIRFAVRMLMVHYLDADFDPAYPEWVCAIGSEEYYVKMMVAWYFATALDKQYDAVLPFLRDGRLDPWTHNKAIQKAVESRRIPDEKKEYLKKHRKQL